MAPTSTQPHASLALRLSILCICAFWCLLLWCSGAWSLPDGRVYEKVSPTENEDAEVYVPFAVSGGIVGFGQGVHTDLPFGASVDGDTVEYVGDPVAGGNGAGGGAGLGENFVATRLPNGGWSRVSPQLLSAKEPLFSVAPPNRSPEEFHSEVVGESGDSSRVFLEANDALTANAVDGGAGADNLYESMGGRLSLVNVLPGGGTEPNATFGGPPFGEPTENPADFSGAVSSDGSTVFWTLLDSAGKPRELFVDEGVGSASERTVQIDTSRDGGTGGGGQFWTASDDGSRVFFTDSDAAQLTASTVPGSGVNLYEYDVLTGVLADLTPVADAGVEGVLGAGENGEYVYFVATAVFDGSGENGEHQSAVPGRDNLYVLRSGGTPVFIGTFSSEDGNKVEPYRRINPFVGFGDWQPGLGHRTAEVSPSGGSVVFMSNESLTGYPDEIPGAGEKLDEVFLYEAGVGRLTCVSCGVVGTVPELNVESQTGIGGFVPISWGGAPQWLGDDGGRVFFDSSEPLVAGDTDGVQDVYEWERDGLGSCATGGGCVFLLSGGVSSSASWLEGVSGSGDDVFFATRARLVPEDGNEAFDLYDARVGGVVPVAPPACTGTGCQGVPAPPPTFATPSSVTFEGVGNFPPPGPEPAVKTKPKALTRAQQLSKALTACHGKHDKRNRTRCEAQARKRYGAAAKQSTRNPR